MAFRHKPRRKARRRLAVGLLIGFAVLPLGRGALGAGGDLIWQDEFDLGGGGNGAGAIAVQGERVFAAGSGVDGNSDWLVRAYTANNGTLLWQDDFDLGGGDAAAVAIAVQEHRVFAAGQAATPSRVQKWIVRAYQDTNGTLLWQDLDVGGEGNVARAIAVQGHRVFAAGQHVNASGNLVWLVRAYDVENGTLLWQDQFDPAGSNAGALAIAVQENRVFVAGGGTNPFSNGDWLVRAYNAQSGALLWQDQFDLGGGRDEAVAIAVQGEQVFAAGRGLEKDRLHLDWLVRAYNAKSGTLLWQDQFALLEGSSGAVAIAARGHQVFAAGGGETPSHEQKWFVRAFDAKNGTLLWQDQFDFNPAVGAGALAIAVQESRVFASGTGSIINLNDWIVRAYNAKNGTLLWEDLFNLGARVNVPLALAVQGNRVLTAGTGLTLSGDEKWLVRAYDAK